MWHDMAARWNRVIRRYGDGRENRHKPFEFHKSNIDGCTVWAAPQGNFKFAQHSIALSYRRGALIGRIRLFMAILYFGYGDSARHVSHILFLYDLYSRSVFPARPINHRWVETSPLINFAPSARRQNRNFSEVTVRCSIITPTGMGKHDSLQTLHFIISYVL